MLVNAGLLVGVLLGICAFVLVLGCVVFWWDHFRRQNKRDVFGHSAGSNSRLRVLQRLRLHRPTLSTQKQQQGIPISLEMGTLDYESYPLDPSGPVDFFSDPMLLDGEGDAWSGNHDSHHLA